MDNFMVSSKDGKTRVDHMQDDIFLSWWKKQPDGSWRYASNDRVFTRGSTGSGLRLRVWKLRMVICF